MELSFPKDESQLVIQNKAVSPETIFIGITLNRFSTFYLYVYAFIHTHMSMCATVTKKIDHGFEKEQEVRKTVVVGGSKEKG